MLENRAKEVEVEDEEATVLLFFEWHDVSRRPSRRAYRRHYTCYDEYLVHHVCMRMYWRGQVPLQRTSTHADTTRLTK
jgi:hypothetical protein